MQPELKFNKYTMKAWHFLPQDVVEGHLPFRVQSTRQCDLP